MSRKEFLDFYHAQKRKEREQAKQLVFDLEESFAIAKQRLVWGF